MPPGKQSAGIPTEGKFRNPAMLLINLVLVSIVVLFLAITYGYLAKLGTQTDDFRLPKVFWMSTLSIVSVSVLLHRLIQAYDRDNVRALRIRLGLALVAALLFSGCQVAGWIQLDRQGLMLHTDPGVAYIYVLTGLHIVHVGAGLIFLLVTVLRMRKFTANHVGTLIYFSDPLRRDRLKMLTHYWHTIDFLWVFLFLAFLYNHT